MGRRILSIGHLACSANPRNTWVPENITMRTIGTYITELYIIAPIICSQYKGTIKDTELWEWKGELQTLPV